LFPFIDQLGRAAGFARDDLPSEKQRKLESLLARADPPTEDVTLLADLLSLPASERRLLPDLSPQHKKQRTLEALIRQLEDLASQQPVVMVFEDAHWIDPTSCELLDLTVEHLRILPVLLLVTFRPEYQPPWTDLPQVTVLALNRLDRALLARPTIRAITYKLVAVTTSRLCAYRHLMSEYVRTRMAVAPRVGAK